MRGRKEIDAAMATAGSANHTIATEELARSPKFPNFMLFLLDLAGRAPL
jgi:hypothetical protein